MRVFAPRWWAVRDREWGERGSGIETDCRVTAAGFSRRRQAGSDVPAADDGGSDRSNSGLPPKPFSISFSRRTAGHSFRIFFQASELCWPWRITVLERSLMCWGVQRFAGRE